MFLVAQRVVTTDGEGINAFYHVHGHRSDWVWELPEGIPDRIPGTVAEQQISVTGRGRVRSFLDLAAPDGTTAQQLQWAHDAIVALVGGGAQFPVVVISGPLFVRYDLESALHECWHDELHALLDAGLKLLPTDSRG